MNDPAYRLPLESRDVGAGALRMIRELLPVLALTTGLLALVALVCVLRGIRADLADLRQLHLAAAEREVRP